MKLFLALPLIALVGCANGPSAADRDFNYRIDSQLAYQWQRYSCVSCMTRRPRSLEGYSKENTARVSVPRRPAASQLPSPRTTQPLQATEQVRQIYDLNQRLAGLEEALKTNASTTNQNEALIVSQIVALKSQLAQLQTPPPVALGTPKPSQETSSGIRIPGND